MKKLLLAALLAAPVAMAQTPSDRLDFYDKADATFTSVMADDVNSLTYTGATENSGYTHIVINADRQLPLSQIGLIRYVKVTSQAFHIDVQDSDQAQFRMLYNFNDPDRPNCVDPDQPYGWRGASAGTPVYFLLHPSKGYDCTYTVTGDYTGKSYLPYVELADSAETAKCGLGVEAWRYYMPFEPTTMVMTPIELQDYAGKPWLGHYQGAELRASSGLMASGKADVTFDLRANTTFEIQQTGDDAINLLDCYAYDEDANTFVNVADPDDVNQSPDYLNVKWAFSGRWVDGVLFLSAGYIPHATVDNRRHYFMADYEYGCSYAYIKADASGIRALLEVKPTYGAAKYFYLDDYCHQIHPATVEFRSGKSLQEASVAYVTYDGELRLKCVNTGSGDPVISFKGAEAGTYTCSNGSGLGTIVLNGFGDATVNGATYDYTINGGIVTISLNGTPTEIVINTSNHTYTVSNSSAWTGAMTYLTTTATGSYQGGSEKDNCTVKLLIDKNVNGTANAGSASVIVEIPTTDGKTLTAVGSTGAYEWNASSRQLTVTNLATYIWTGSKWEYGRRNMVFQLSDDLQTATLTTEVFGSRLYAIAKDSSYITLPATLQAQK